MSEEAMVDEGVTEQEPETIECPTCDGSGLLLGEPCDNCGGMGKLDVVPPPEPTDPKECPATPRIPDDAAAELFALNREITKATTLVESTKARASEAKKAYDLAVAKLHTFVTDLERPLPLFDRKPEDVAPEAPPEPEGERELCPDCEGAGRTDAEAMPGSCKLCSGKGYLVVIPSEPVSDTL